MTPIARFDPADESVQFLGFFLLEDGRTGETTLLPT